MPVPASFTAPDVNRDSTFTFVVSVKDDKGTQDLDSVKVLVKNLDTGTPSTSSNSNGNNNAASEQTNTNANIKTNPNPMGNTTTRALTNAQKNTGNNNRNIGNTSQLQSPTLSTQMARTSAITVQALLTPLQAFPTNGFVNNRAFYDISFQTASSGTIRFVSLTFPAGTQVSQAAVVEVSGIGDGTFSSSGQTMTYTVKSPTPIAAGLTIRLQVDYVLNPPTPSPASGYKIQVTTKDTNGATIDSGSTSGYVIKQIQQQDIGNNQIYSSNIQDGQVATKDIADNAITTAKIQNDQVQEQDIATNAVTNRQIIDNSILTNKILDGQVGTTDLADNTISSAKIEDGQVGSTDLAPGAIVPHIIQRVSPSKTLGPGIVQVETLINCDSGEVATGGGFFLGTLASPDPTSKVIIQRSVANTPIAGNQQGWIVWATNTDTVSHDITAVVGCLKLTP